MRKPLVPLALLGLLAGPLPASTPVHVALKASATVDADADGFFTLGSVAELSGGDAAQRVRFRDVRVGRAPLPDQVRQVTPGDVLLKLRQAGFHPESDAVLEGARKIAVTVGARPQAPSADAGTATAGLHPPPSVPDAAPLVRRGDVVSILIQDGALTISARGAARDSGGVGDPIHVHREGVMTDLVVTVQDAQTVRLEL